MKTDGSNAKEAGTGATAPTKAKQNAVAPAKQDTIGAMIERLKPQLEKALPKHVTTERLARVALTAIRNNPKLQKADALSLMGAIMQAAQLGLEPNTPLGHCYLIPYKNGKTGRYDVQFQMGYKGLIDLAQRSQQYRKLIARSVDSADKFDYAYGLDEYLVHKPAETPSGENVYYYAMYELDNGGRSFTVWSRDKVLAHAQKYSQSWDREKKAFRNASAWQTAFDQMACKTVLIDLLRYAPKSVEVAQAANADNATFTVNPDDPDLIIQGEYTVEGE